MPKSPRLREPSLNALRAFEATVRLRSMTAAAAELDVTHGAISHHVRALEETYGLPLLLRTHGALLPTHDGRRLAEGLTAAFGLIAASVATLRPAPLTLSCSATIMMNWLIPRIAAFHARHPHVALQMNVSHDTLDFIGSGVSVALRSSVVPPPRDAITRELMTEWIGPVCSPDYLAAHRPDTVDALARARLLSTKTRPGAWQEWIAASGEAATLPAPHDSFEHFYLLIQAACCGLGTAVVPKMLVEAELAAGRLVAPFGFVAGRRRLVLWIAPHLASQPDTRALTEWLTEELRE